MVERFIEDIPYLNIHFGGQFVNNEVLDWCEKVYFLDEIKNIVCVTSKNILVYSKHSTIIKYFKENYSSKFLIIK